MNLKQIQAFDFYFQKYSLERPDFKDKKLVIEYKNHLITSKFVPLDNDQPRTMTLAIENPYKENPFLDGAEDNPFFLVAANEYFRKHLLSDFNGNFKHIYQTLEPFVFDFSFLVTDKIDQNKSELKISAKNVTFLDLDLKFDEYTFPSDAQFEPVSLIDSIKEN